MADRVGYTLTGACRLKQRAFQKSLLLGEWTVPLRESNINSIASKYNASIIFLKFFVIYLFVFFPFFGEPGVTCANFTTEVNDAHCGIPVSEGVKLYPSTSLLYTSSTM